MRKHAALCLFAILALGILHALSMYYASLSTFIAAPLGVLIRTILIGIIIVNGPAIIRYILVKYNSEHLVRHLITLARNGHTFQCDLHRKLFLRLFRRKVVTPEYLDSLKPQQAAIFVIGLQFYYDNLRLSEKLDLQDLIKIAEKASHCQWYRTVLLAISLNAELNPSECNYEFAESLLERAIGSLGVRYNSEEADHRLFSHLQKATEETIYIFSTTSQISNLSFDFLLANVEKLAEVNLFMVSPLLLSDQALLGLSSEYEVPDFTIPKGQFISDRPLDMLRRVIRILAGIERTAEFYRQTNIKINLYLFRRSYPNIKIRLLAKRPYLQILPGCLRYANNLYRFGIDVAEPNLIDPIRLSTEQLMSNEDSCFRLELDPVNVSQLRRKAFREALWYLLREHRDCGAIEKYRPEFRLIVKSAFTDSYLNEVLGLSRAMHRFVEEYAFGDDVVGEKPERNVYERPGGATGDKVTIRLESGVERHVSVGVLFIADGQLLLLQKRRSPYDGRWSIVAGHAEWDESPLAAARREVREEIGIDVAGLSLVKHYDSIIGDICRYNVYEHEWYVFLCTDLITSEDICCDADELIGYEWVRLEELQIKRDLTFATDRILKDMKLI